MSEQNNFSSSINPTELEAGGKIHIKCAYSGKLNFGFFDVAMLDQEEKPVVWMPDRGTWMSYRDTGILTGESDFSTQWDHFIPDWIPEGKYKFRTMVYDDKTGKNLGKREPIAKNEHIILIKSSKHPDAILVRKFYKLFLERIPDMIGYQTWFNNLQILKANRRQVLEIGFLRCPEFRARFIHRLLRQKDVKSEELEPSVKLLMQHSISTLVKEKYQNAVHSNDELKKLVKTTFRLDENGSLELEKVVNESLSVAENIEIVIINFLLEKYILISYLFPESPDDDIQKKVRIYLTNPDEIISEL